MSNKQRGDTIIEVLLAMTVIGLVLGSSYAIANRSLRIGREAQERTEGLKLVETQLERLRTVSGIRGNILADPTAFSSTISAFCINDAIEVVQFNKPDFDSFTEIVRDEVQYPDLSGDRPCNQGTDGRYGIVITRSEEDQTYLYTIRARWEAIGGGPLQELQSQYRIYPIGNTAFEVINAASLTSPADLEDQVPAIATPRFTLSGLTEGVLSATIVSNGTTEPTEQGFLISRTFLSDNDFKLENVGNNIINPDASISLLNATQVSGGAIRATIGSLLPGQSVYVRPFATNSEGTGYGNVFTFSAPNLDSSEVTVNKRPDGKIYLISKDRVNWTTARQKAEASGGHLVTISSAEENAIVSELVNGQRAWIGMNDIAEEGKWVWANGEPVTYTNWAPNEPNDYLNGNPGEDGAVMNWTTTGPQGNWNDWLDYERAFYVIEYQLDE